MSTKAPPRQRTKSTGIPAKNKKIVREEVLKSGKTDQPLKYSKKQRNDEEKKKDEKTKKKAKVASYETSISGKKEVNKEKASLVKPESIDETYEDDFEDYSDDFESDASVSNLLPGEEISSEEHKISNTAVMPSLDKENENVDSDVEDLPLEDTPMMRRLVTSQGRREIPIQQQPDRQEKQAGRVVSATEKTINFTTSQTFYYDAFKNSEARYQKLRELITLESVTFVIMDKTPMKDYDFYMQLFGDRGTMQTAVQTRDDDITQSVQTEQPTFRTIWTQAPATISGDWGGTSPPRGDNDDDAMSIFRENHLGSDRLKKFIETASRIVLEILALKNKEGTLLDLGERSDLCFSTGVHTFKLHPLASKYKCTSLTKNGRGNQTITCAFMIEESVAVDIVGRSLIVETIMDSSLPPERLLLCNAEVSSMSYSPDGIALYVAMKDGSVAAFDLLAGDSISNSRLPWIDSTVDLVLRRPSFDTSLLAAHITAEDTAPAISIHSTTNLVFVLDASATLYLYGIQRDEIPKIGKTAGAMLSMCLTAIVKPDATIMKSSNQPVSLIANCMAVLDENHYVIGTDAGFLCSINRNKNVASRIGPRLYRGKMQSFGEVTALRVNPFEPKILVAGMSTGSLQLIHINQAAPLLILTPPAAVRLPVTSVEWSPTSSTGIYSWHGGLKLLFWDISMKKSLITMTDLPIPIYPGVTASWLETLDQRIGFMAHATADGSVEVHALEPPKSNIGIEAAFKQMNLL